MEDLVVGVACLLVEARVVLLYFVVGEVQHIDARVVLELVLAADVPHLLLLLDHFGFAQSQRQLGGGHFEV